MHINKMDIFACGNSVFSQVLNAYLILSEEIILRVVTSARGSALLAAAVRVLDLGPRDHHGHRIMALLAAATVMATAGVAAAHGAVLPGAASWVGVSAGTGVEVGSGTAWWLLNAWSRDHVVRLSLEFENKHILCSYVDYYNYTSINLK
jgi:hypothetical protein